jgi:two-component system sensor histidine kinase ChvG
VPGDAARLERVLENLLDNAVSFSPPARCESSVMLERARPNASS